MLTTLAPIGISFENAYRIKHLKSIVLGFVLVALTRPVLADIRVCYSQSENISSTTENGTVMSLPFFDAPYTTGFQYDCSPVISLVPNGCVMNVPRGRVRGDLYTFSSYVPCPLDDFHGLGLMAMLSILAFLRIKKAC